MCGIVGLFSYGETGLSLNHTVMFRQMMYADALRGMHGTGAFAVDEKGNMHRVRVGGPPSQLFGTQPWRDFDDFMWKRNIRFAVGHNRHATKGKHITEHAHPFRDEHIVLVHNGTLEKYSHLPDYHRDRVDSELLCHAIAKNGVENIIPDLEGAWTIVWWDSKLLQLRILRNEERPLYMAVHETEKLIGIASEDTMLDWIFQRNGLYQYKIEQVPEDTLMSFSLGNIVPTEVALKGKPSVKGIKHYYELAFESPGDACSTTCGVETDKDVKQAAPASGTGTRQLPVAVSGGKQSAKKAKAASGVLGSWRGVEFLHDICKGDEISLFIVDYDLMDSNAKDMYQVRCQSLEYPDVDFRVNVRGESVMEDLVAAKYGLRGKVFSIMKSDQPPAVNPHRIYVHQAEPANAYRPKTGFSAVN